MSIGIKTCLDFMSYVSAAITCYSVKEPLIDRIKKRQNDTEFSEEMEDLLSVRKMEEIVRESVLEVVNANIDKLKNDNYEIFLDSYKSEVVKEIISKNNELTIYCKDIESYIEEINNYLFNMVEQNADEGKILKTIISFQNRQEKNDKNNLEEINKQFEAIKELIYTVGSETKIRMGKIEDKFNLKLQNIQINCEKEKNASFYCFFSFELDDDNYRIEPERIYMAVESKTGIRSINRVDYFLPSKYKGKFSIKFSIPQEGIRVIDTMGLVFLTKIRNREVYYIKLFGRRDEFTNDFYYEQLTKDEYEDELKKYDNSYKNSINTKYELWGFYGEVVYADF